MQPVHSVSFSGVRYLGRITVPSHAKRITEDKFWEQFRRELCTKYAGTSFLDQTKKLPMDLFEIYKIYFSPLYGGLFVPVLHSREKGSKTYDICMLTGFSAWRFVQRFPAGTFKNGNVLLQKRCVAPLQAAMLDITKEPTFPFLKRKVRTAVKAGWVKLFSVIKRRLKPVQTA